MPNNLKSIEQHWQEFSALVFKRTNAGQVQRDEMKKAFFAGAFALLIATDEIGEDHVSEEEAMQYLSDIREEGLQFSKRILAEYARRN